MFGWSQVKGKLGMVMKSFPVRFLCFNFTGAWFSLMTIGSSHLIQYYNEFGETGL